MVSDSNQYWERLGCPYGQQWLTSPEARRKYIEGRCLTAPSPPGLIPVNASHEKLDIYMCSLNYH
jgi:hypothetical protein